MTAKDEGQVSPQLLAALDAVGAQPWSGYLEQPLPCEADEIVAALVAGFEEAPAPAREGVRRRVGCTHARALGLFAVRMATLAVRERSAERLRIGLCAAVLSAGERADWRDLGDTLHLLSDAAIRIGADGPTEFANAARFARGWYVGYVQRFPPRWGWHRLAERAAMVLGLGDWRAVEASDGFRYVPRRSAEEVRQEVESMVRRIHGDAPPG